MRHTGSPCPENDARHDDPSKGLIPGHGHLQGARNWESVTHVLRISVTHVFGLYQGAVYQTLGALECADAPGLAGICCAGSLLKRMPLCGILLTELRSVTDTPRLFTSQDSLEALTALLHEAYAAHAAEGRRFFASYQAPADTERRISRGECWVVMDGEDLIGTITVAAPYSFPVGYPAPTPAATYYQLAVRPTHQGRGLGRQLVGLAEQRIRDRGISNLAIDTSSQATTLIAWYRCLGYRDAGRWHWDVTNYKSIVLAKALSSKGATADTPDGGSSNLS